jgi:biopolymer transport protein ExbD
MRIRHHARDDKVELQMTPMIDIVFQLNIFFLFTFQIILPEGDFNIRMPAPNAARAADPSESLPMALVMKAGPNGELTDLRIDNRALGTDEAAFARLRQYVRDRITDAGGPGKAADQEIEIDCDYDLQYDYVIKAITAVTGYIDRNNQRHQLIERIKFTPPKKGLGVGG